MTHAYADGMTREQGARSGTKHGVYQAVFDAAEAGLLSEGELLDRSKLRAATAGWRQFGDHVVTTHALEGWEHSAILVTIKVAKSVKDSAPIGIASVGSCLVLRRPRRRMAGAL